MYKIFKRKGTRVRYINTSTAKVGRWVRDPELVTREARNAVAEVALNNMTVAELRVMAHRLGVNFTSKTRKPVLVSSIAAV